MSHFLLGKNIIFLNKGLKFCRVNSNEQLETLREHIHRPIEISESLTLPQPLHDRFVEAFLKEIKNNPKYYYENKEV